MTTRTTTRATLIAALGLLAAQCAESQPTPSRRDVDASRGVVVRLVERLDDATIHVESLAVLSGQLAPAAACDVALREEFAADASWPREWFDGAFRDLALAGADVATTPHVAQRPQLVDGASVVRIEDSKQELSTIVAAGADETWLVRARVKPLRAPTKDEATRRAGLAYVPIATPLPKLDEVVTHAKEVTRQWRAKQRVVRLPAESSGSTEWRELRLLARPYRGRTGLVVSLLAGEQGMLVDWLEVRRLTPIETLALAPDESVEPVTHPLHRHVDVGMETWDALALPSGSSVEWSVVVPRVKPRLELAAAALVERGGRDVELSIAVDGSGVAKRTAAAPTAPTSALATASSSTAPAPWTVDLAPFAGRSVKLTLVASGPPDSVALFLAPTLLGTPDLPPATATTSAPSSPRNVLLISIDTLRADHLGCYGAKDASTPRIDSLARDGVRFADVLSPASYTLPTHLSMMSGQDPLVHETVRPNEPMDWPRTAMVARRFADAGFRTAAFTGGGLVHPRHGFGVGFDSYSIRDPSGVVGLFHFTGEENDEDARPGEDRLARAIDFLARSADVPFFAFVHTYLVHNYRPSQRDLDAQTPPGGARPTPEELTTLRESAEKGERTAIDRLHALYRASIAQVDREVVGRLLDALERLHLADRTLVVLVADHGEEFFEHAMIGHGFELWHDLTHVPWIVRGPGIPHGVVRDDPVSLADVAATIAGRFALAPEPRVLARDQLAAALATEDVVDEARVLSLREIKERPDQDALVQWPWKLVVKRTPPPIVTLYRLDEDPGETRDRAAQEPQRVAGMRRRLDAKLLEARVQARLFHATSDERVLDLTAEQERMLDQLGYTKHGDEER